MEKCQVTQSFLSSLPHSLPLTSFLHKTFVIQWKGRILMGILAPTNSLVFLGLYLGMSGVCIYVYACRVCKWARGYEDKGRVSKDTEFSTYILHSSSFSSQTVGRSFMLWHRYSFASEGLWLIGAESQVFSWTFLSHAWLWLLFSDLWALFRNTSITGRDISPFFFLSGLACLPHVWFRKQNPFLCKQPDMWHTFTQRIHTKHGKRRLLVLHLNCFSYVVGMWPHVSIFIFRRWFHVCNILLQWLQLQWNSSVLCLHKKRWMVLT